MSGPSSGPMLAVDIGGTKIAAALVGPNGQIIDSARRPTPHDGPRESVSGLCKWLGAFLGSRVVAGVGIALPAVTRAGRIEWIAATLPGWGKVPVADAVAQTAGVPVWCEFDGYAAAQGEAWCGAARGADSAAIVIVGTGIGAGFIQDGKVLRGKVGAAGTMGWLRFPQPDRDSDVLGPPIESYASGVGLLQRARAYQPSAHTPFRTTDDVFAAALTGDPAASRAVCQATTAITSLVLVVMSAFAPEVVVLSGGMGKRPDLVARVRGLVTGAGHPLSEVRTTIVASTLKAPSSLYGAARYAYENL